MSRSQLSRICREAQSTCGQGESAFSVPPSPRQNRLLAALPADAYQRILPDLKPLPLPRGWIIHGAGDQESYLYFLASGIVSRFCVTQNGASKEFAVTGTEGVIGLASFLGGESTPTGAMVLSAGYAYRMPAGALHGEFEHDGPLPRLLLRYIGALITQIGQIAACNRRHTLDRRFCRWILSCFDRLSSNELTVTQEMIAHMLGVRREGVTEAAGRLERAGLIDHKRGRIVVLDRVRLEAHACECYSVIKQAYDQLPRGDGPPGTSGVHGPRPLYVSGRGERAHFGVT